MDQIHRVWSIKKAHKIINQKSFNFPAATTTWSTLSSRGSEKDSELNFPMLMSQVMDGIQGRWFHQQEAAMFTRR